MQEIKRHERSLLQLDRSAADANMVEEALQGRVCKCWETIEDDRHLLNASHVIQRWLATEEDPDAALAKMTDADVKRRLADGL
ncbi:hypothetical protein [Cupriavidus pampae]|nr:hypothetical protein [Cupriavidus pampae]